MFEGNIASSFSVVYIHPPLGIKQAPLKQVSTTPAVNA